MTNPTGTPELTADECAALTTGQTVVVFNRQYRTFWTGTVVSTEGHTANILHAEGAIIPVPHFYLHAA